MSLVRVPEVFAKVNSAQIPSPFKVGSCREVFVAFHIRAVFTWLSKVIEELVWFWFYYALWLASVFTLVLVLRQSSENRSNMYRWVLTPLFFFQIVIATPGRLIDVLGKSFLYISHFCFCSVGILLYHEMIRNYSHWFSSVFFFFEITL